MDTQKIANKISRHIYKSCYDRKEMAIELEKIIHTINLQALENLSSMLKKKIILHD